MSAPAWASCGNWRVSEPHETQLEPMREPTASSPDWGNFPFSDPSDARDCCRRSARLARKGRRKASPGDTAMRNAPTILISGMPYDNENPTQHRHEQLLEIL